MTLIARLAAGFAALIAAGTAAAQTPAYSANYIFGDSLSDRGNLAEKLGYNFPTPPFANDSFTNGDVAVAVLSAKLGLAADPSLFVTGFADTHHLGLTPGTNYAVAQATASGVGGIGGANFGDQITAYLDHVDHVAAADALYTIFIGGNDVRGAALSGNAALVSGGVAAELAGIGQLAAAGARNFLIVNVTDIGAIPEFNLYDQAQAGAATTYTQQYNALLATGIGTLAAGDPAATFRQFDLYGFTRDILPGQLAAAGVTDLGDNCYVDTTTGTPTPATNAGCGPIDPATRQAANIGTFAYWDDVHPTAVVHAAIGNALYAAVVAPVPEPATWAAMLLGFAVAGAALRRRRGAAALPA